MFGYVTPLKAEMKVKDYNRFKSYYCGLCFQIKKDFGNLPRMALNYDMTFLALLLDGLIPQEIEVTSCRCLIHPSSKKPIVINNNAISYSSSMNLSLFYYKLLDDVQDDKNLKSKLKVIMLSPYKRKFPKAIILINSKIQKHLEELSFLEQDKNFTSIDEICDPFSKLVGDILKDYPYKLNDDNETLRNILYSLGYSIGKWIYLIDALDDLKSDIEKNKFNPINFLYNKENLNYTELVTLIKPRIEFTILNCACTCKDNLSKLNLNKNKDILHNIIELGLMDKYINIIDKAYEIK
ncbi:DUF5685 family protein [Clostridium uliginosum]|uniref:Uncharacterized protein n=1 Tax=Clostridium uliginosum TaxID=119641 RepID=A0A1I1RS04_9CLOT|nr:DUF5685 family protein [Clostridium uliginosum]SFD37126.1 hypothetical protein SAMN05421842_1383 [Clostridium uliginosum]